MRLGLVARFEDLVFRAEQELGGTWTRCSRVVDGPWETKMRGSIGSRRRELISQQVHHPPVPLGV